MGRQAEGHRIHWKRGWAYVHFSHDKERYRIPLGTKDPRAAAAAGAREHAAVVSGRRRKAVASFGSTLRPLAVLLAEWIAAQEGALDETTRKTLETYARTYIGFFVSMDRITDAACGDFGRARLRRVIRKTAQKELSYLRGFLGWCKEQGAIALVPTVPPLPKKATGTRSGKQRARPVEITETQALAILERLPPESKTIGGRKWPLRDRFGFAWETALRPASLALLSVPENWRPGATELTLGDEEDKARFGRTLPLSAGAVAILERHLPPEGKGLVFGRHCFNKNLKHAATAVLGEAEGARFASYDFRHGRGTQLADEGASLTGIAYLMGHKQLTTTNRYLKPSRRAAAKALAALEARDVPAAPSPGAAPILSPFGHRAACCDSRSLSNSATLQGDRRGSNPRQLEPQRNRDTLTARYHSNVVSIGGPQKALSGTDSGTGCQNFSAAEIARDLAPNPRPDRDPLPLVHEATIALLALLARVA